MAQGHGSITGLPRLLLTGFREKGGGKGSERYATNACERGPAARIVAPKQHGPTICEPCYVTPTPPNGWVALCDIRALLKREYT